MAERKHCHLLNVARALLFQASLPKKFGGNAILTTTYLINRTPTPILKDKTPFELLFHKQPTYNHLRVFGCQCFASTHHHCPTKFDARATCCIFLGYPYSQKGYRVYDPSTGKTFVSQDVLFHESIFPFSSSAADLHLVLPQIQESSYDGDISTSLPSNTHITPPSPGLPFPEDPPSLDPPTSPVASPPAFPITSSPLTTPAAPPRSTRATHVPTYLREYHVGISLPSQTVPSSNSASAEPTSILYPLSDVLSYDRLSPEQHAFTISISAETEPRSFAQGINDPNWHLAMQQELAALESNGTWSLQPLHLGKKLVGCKWVYKIKCNSDGTVD